MLPLCFACGRLLMAYPRAAIKATTSSLPQQSNADKGLRACLGAADQRPERQRWGAGAGAAAPDAGRRSWPHQLRTPGVCRPHGCSYAGVCELPHHAHTTFSTCLACGSMAQGCFTACPFCMQGYSAIPPNDGPYMREVPSLNSRRCCCQRHDGMQAFQNSAGSAGQLSSAPSAPPSGLPSQQEVCPAAALYPFVYLPGFWLTAA